MESTSKLYNRRDFMKMLSAGTIASFIPGCKFRSKQKQPNILFIAVDDLRPELGCYENSHVLSPNIDRLARHGMVFNKAYCQSAVCNPSRASLLTGLRPDTIKVWDLWTDFRETMPDVITLPQYFKHNGYHTVGIGKIYHNTIPDPQSWSEEKLHIKGYPFDPDAVYRTKEQMEHIELRKQSIISEGKQDRYIDRLGEWYLKASATEIADPSDEVYYDEAQTDVAIMKLAELKEKESPFFFAVGYYRPHLPFNVPKKYWDMYDRDKIELAENDYLPKNAPAMAINNLRELRGYTDFKNIPKPHEGRVSENEARLLKHGYLASVSYIDTQVGRLLDQLDKLGIRNNTIIVLWGDHGWKLGEHNSWCKMTNYEIDTRVPLIISSPDLNDKKLSCDQLVEFVDIYPTLCEMSGLTVPKNLEGTSLVPLIKDPANPLKKAVFSQFLREGIWIAPDGIEYMGYSIRSQQYRYVEWVNWETKELAAKELYDHYQDPQENVNIAGNNENLGIMQTLSEQLKSGWKNAILN